MTAYTQTCPVAAPGRRALHRRQRMVEASLPHPHLRLLGGAQSFTSAGGNPLIAAEFDPILLGEEAESAGDCTTVKPNRSPTPANYTTVSKGFTLMGMPAA